LQLERALSTIGVHVEVTMSRITSRIALVLFALSGCGGTPPPLYGESSGQTTMTTAPPPDMAMVKYPEGPYGNQADEVLANLTFEGYRLTPMQSDSTMLTWEKNLSFNDFHANPKCKCLLITFGALWCPACQQEQPKLVDDVGGDDSFCVLGIVQEGATNGKAAVQEDVLTWTQDYHQNFSVVKGTNQARSLWQGWDMNGSIGLPFNMIVRPDTMQVMDVVQGFEQTIHDHAMSLCGGQ